MFKLVLDYMFKIRFEDMLQYWNMSYWIYPIEKYSTLRISMSLGLYPRQGVIIKPIITTKNSLLQIYNKIIVYLIFEVSVVLANSKVFTWVLITKNTSLHNQVSTGIQGLAYSIL